MGLKEAMAGVGGMGGLGRGWVGGEEWPGNLLEYGVDRAGQRTEPKLLVRRELLGAGGARCRHESRALGEGAPVTWASRGEGCQVRAGAAVWKGRCQATLCPWYPRLWRNHVPDFLLHTPGRRCNSACVRSA